MEGKKDQSVFYSHQVSSHSMGFANNPMRHKEETASVLAINYSVKNLIKQHYLKNKEYVKDANGKGSFVKINYFITNHIRIKFLLKKKLYCIENDYLEFIDVNKPYTYVTVPERKALLLKQQELEATFGRKLPYHQQFPEAWTLEVEDVHIYDVEYYIYTSIERFRYMFAELYGFEYGEEDSLYLFHILQDRKGVLSGEINKPENIIKISRIDEAIISLMKLMKGNVNSLVNIDLARSAEPIAKEDASSTEAKALNIDDYLTIRFTRFQLDTLLQDLGVIIKQGNLFIVKPTQKAYQWTAIRKALETLSLASFPSHEKAALAFNNTYGAKVSRATMGNYSPGPVKTRMPKGDEFYYRVLKLLSASV